MFDMDSVYMSFCEHPNLDTGPLDVATDCPEWVYSDQHKECGPHKVLPEFVEEYFG
jgi:hypothetical protein